jgi:hypothetical protein
MLEFVAKQTNCIFLLRIGTNITMMVVFVPKLPLHLNHIFDIQLNYLGKESDRSYHKE